MDKKSRTRVWVGYRLGDVIKRLPQEVLEAFNERDRIVVNEFVIQAFSVGGLTFGIGHQVLECDWDVCTDGAKGVWVEGATQVDFASLETSIKDAWALIEIVFKNLYSIDDKPSLFITSDNA